MNSGLLDRVRGALARETSSGKFIAEIDGLRCVAVLAVLGHHISGWVALKYGELAIRHSSWGDAAWKVVDQGFVGVQLFFAISGFILALPFAVRALERREGPSIRGYFVRRITRLEPPYIASLVAWTCALALAGVIGADNLEPIRDWRFFPHFAASAAYLHNAVYNAGSTINRVAWSLEIEAQFYILAPLLALVYRVRRHWWRRTLLVVAILGAAIYQQARPDPGLFLHGLTLIHHLHYFLIGFLLVDLYLLHWRGKEATSVGDAVGLVGWCGIVALMVARSAVDLLLPWCILAAYSGTFNGRISRVVMRWWPIVTVGGMCYTIYLFHYLILSAVGKVTKSIVVGGSYDGTAATYLLAMTIIILAGSSLLFVVIEKPFMKREWPSRLASLVRSVAPNRGAGRGRPAGDASIATCDELAVDRE